jgi:hypothetical protein
LLAGYSNSGISGEKFQPSRGGIDYWVVMINATGAKQWEQAFGGTADDYLFSALKSIDGSFLLAGTSNSGRSGDKSESSQGGNDYWVVKITNKGKKQWDKRFGGADNEILRSVIKTSQNGIPDDGYLLAGYSKSAISGDKSQDCRGGYDYWVVKTTSETALVQKIGVPVIIVLATPGKDATDAARLSSESTTSPEESTVSFSAHPNPFTDRATLAFKVTGAQTQRVNLQVYDMQGKSVANLYSGEALPNENYQFELTAATLPAGMFIARLRVGNKVTHLKLVLVR